MLFPSVGRDKELQSLNWPFHHEAPDIMSLLRDVPKAVSVCTSLPELGANFSSTMSFSEEPSLGVPGLCLLKICLESQEPVRGDGETLPTSWGFSSPSRNVIKSKAYSSNDI